MNTAVLIVATVLAHWPVPGADAAEANLLAQIQARGRIIYDRACQWCHGTGGRGDGPAGWAIGRFSAPRPRDFIEESFKFRSTPSGHLPTDQDLFRIITHGITGVMPPYDSLTESERWDVIAYIKSFYTAFQTDTPLPVVIPDSPNPPSEASIATGRQIYRMLGCQSCHGETGKDNNARADLIDSRGLAIRPADLTTPRSFKNGSRPEDIYRTLLTGLDGTPMPSYAEHLSGHEEDGWHLVHYILFLSTGRGP